METPPAQEVSESGTKPEVRKTRSGRIVRPPPPSKSPKTPGKKTRKKMVLMEVEVSDEEEATHDQEHSQEAVSETPEEKENGASVIETETETETINESEKAKEADNIGEISEKEENNEVSQGNDMEENDGKITALEEAVQSNINELHNSQDSDKSEPSKRRERSESPIPTKKVKKTDASEPKLVVTVERLDAQTIATNACEKKSKDTEKLDSSKKHKTSENQVSDKLSSPKKGKLSEKEISVEKKEKDVEKVESDVIVSEKKVLKNVKAEEKAARVEFEESQSREDNGSCKSDDVDMKECVQQPDRNENREGTAKKHKDKSAVKNELEKKVEDKVETENEVEVKEDTVGNSDVGKECKSEVESSGEEKMDQDEDEAAKPSEDDASKKKDIVDRETGDPDTENISEDELPSVQVAKVPETEEVSDEELPGPKRAELPADTEVVSEDELPTVKKESNKRKLNEGEYDPASPSSEHEAPTKKPALEATVEKEKEEKPAKPKKLPELDKYWKAVNDDPTDFTGWTYLLQYVDQENDMEAAREAYDAFLSHYPYCYGYWRKYADYEKRKGNKKKCEEVFERGFKAIPLSVDLWIHYMTYVKTTRADDEDFIRSQFERALSACGLEFRSDRLWDSYIKWETEGKRPQKVTGIYDRLLATPTQGYTSHFDNFQEHITTNAPNKAVEVDEFLALRKEVRHALKQHETNTEADNVDAPPGDEDPAKIISTDEETKAIRERIISIRRKIHKNTSAAVTARWNFEEGIKRPYFHVKPLERCQLKNWQDYLDYEIEHGDKMRTIVLFERCLIACALYEEFWMKFVHYLEGLKDAEMQMKIRDVYERACTIHHLKKPNLHLLWAVFEEGIQNHGKAAEILVNLEKSVPNVLQIAYRRINLERRRGDHDKCSQLYEHYMNNSKNKVIASNIAIKYSRFCLKIVKNLDRAAEILKNAMTKDPVNPRLYLQLIDLTLQREGVPEKEVTELIDSFLEKEGVESEQKVLFAQRKLEFLEDFGSDIHIVQKAYEDYQKYIKQNKESAKKKEAKSEPPAPSKKDNKPVAASTTSNTYGNYGNYSNSGQGSYQYSGSQGQYGYPQYGQGDQYQYQGWQYQQGNYGGYNQWGSYGSGYGY